MSTRSWRSIADTLARQLAAYAVCPEHPLDAPDDFCQMCGNRAAYQVWVAMTAADSRSRAIHPSGRSYPPGDHGTVLPLAGVRRAAEGALTAVPDEEGT